MTMTKLTASRLTLVVGCLANAAVAQDPVAPSGPNAVVRQACGLRRDGDAALVGGGADYKVAFDQHGAVFVPALGRGASRSYPFRLALQSIQRGGRDAGVAAFGAATAPRREGNTAVYDLAPGVSERWEVQGHGVELSLRFERSLAHAGDLVVRFAVDTELVAQAAGEQPRGLRFSAEGVGGVRVGAVTAVAADGRTAPGALRLEGTYLELVLPGAFVDTASYPLVLDPLIGTELLVAGGGLDDINPDVAYDLTNSVYLACWQREFSVSDVDVVAQRVGANGSPVGSMLFVRSPSTGLATSPTVANVNLTDRFLVAWQEGPSFLGPWDVRGACVDAASGTVSAAATLAGNATLDEIDPDAGGETTTLDDEALLVWDEQGTIYGAQVTCPAGTGPPIPFGAGQLSQGGVDKHRAAISKNGGASGRHLVAYLHGSPPGATAGVETAVVDRNMNLLAVGALSHWNWPAGLAIDPDVDGDGTTFVVVWDEYEPSTLFSRDVYCERVDFDPGTNTMQTVIANVAVAADPGEDERAPAVGFLGQKVVVAWAQRSASAPTPFDHDVVVRALDLGCSSCGPEQILGAGGRAYDQDPQIATAMSGGSTNDQAFIAFASADALPPYASEVRGQLFEAIGSGGAVASAGGGCGTGGIAGVNGPLALGNSSFAFTLTGAHPAAAIAVFVLNAPVAPIPCGPCLITPPLVSATLPAAGGSATLPVPISCDQALLGGMVQFQWWVASTAASPCALLPNTSFSDRVNATIGL